MNNSNPWIYTLIATLGATAAIADSMNQRSRRKDDAQRLNEAIEGLSEDILRLEARHRELQAKLGQRNHQVRVLAEEIARLRSERTDLWRRRDAA